MAIQRREISQGSRHNGSEFMERHLLPRRQLYILQRESLTKRKQFRFIAAVGGRAVKILELVALRRLLMDKANLSWQLSLETVCCDEIIIIIGDEHHHASSNPILLMMMITSGWFRFHKPASYYSRVEIS